MFGVTVQRVGWIAFDVAFVVLIAWVIASIRRLQRDGRANAKTVGRLYALFAAAAIGVALVLGLVGGLVSRLTRTP